MKQVAITTVSWYHLYESSDIARESNYGMFQWYSMHDPGAASTVHSYYGSGIADLSRGQLSDRLIGTID